jgi:hypothetical protein
MHSVLIKSKTSKDIYISLFIFLLIYQSLSIVSIINEYQQKKEAFSIKNNLIYTCILYFFIYIHYIFLKFKHTILTN